MSPAVPADDFGKLLRPTGAILFPENAAESEALRLFNGKRSRRR